MLAFGYAANGEAADPAAPLSVAVTVGPDGVVRSIAVSWGTWTHEVTYRSLGSTPSPEAPENARPLKELRQLQRSG